VNRVIASVLLLAIGIFISTSMPKIHEITHVYTYKRARELAYNIKFTLQYVDNIERQNSNREIKLVVEIPDKICGYRYTITVNSSRIALLVHKNPTIKIELPINVTCKIIESTVVGKRIAIHGYGGVIRIYGKS